MDANLLRCADITFGPESRPHGCSLGVPLGGQGVVDRFVQ
jgi:hypothetical protein